MKRSMNQIPALASLCALSAQAQMSISPSAYSVAFTSQNNYGTIRQDWRNSSRDEIVLAAKVLTFRHIVYFSNTPLYGSKLGAPKLLEDTYYYQQIGSAGYWPIGGQAVTYFAPRKAGGWIASTNYVSRSDMVPLTWLPGVVGRFEIGDGMWRVVTSASSLNLTARNLNGSPRLLKIFCSGGAEFVFVSRFAANETKALTLGLDATDCEWFSFELQNATGEATL